MDPKNRFNQDTFASERGDIPINPPAAQRTPPDIIKNKATRDAIATLGDGSSQYTVESVFNTRPVNGYDVLRVLPIVEIAAAGTATGTLTIRAQKVLVVDKIFFDATPIPGIIGPTSTGAIKLNVLLNGVAVDGMTNLPLERLYGTYIPAYFIAGPNDIITLSTVVTVALTGVVQLVYMIGGTELLYQGRGKQYEIANDGPSVVRSTGPITRG